jgi:hypothetical protein
MSEKPTYSGIARDWWRKADKPAWLVAISFFAGLFYFRSWPAAFTVSLPIYIAMLCWLLRHEPFGRAAKIIAYCLIGWVFAAYLWYLDFTPGR